MQGLLIDHSSYDLTTKDETNNGRKNGRSHQIERVANSEEGG